MAELTLPYADHPEFRFDATSVAVSDQAVHSFNQLYDRIAKLPRRPSIFAGERLRFAVHRALDAVFDDILANGPTTEFQEFLHELRPLCQRVLADDLNHFLGTRKRMKLADESLVSNLQALESHLFYLGQLSDSCRERISSLAAEEVTRLRSVAASGNTRREDLSINAGPLVTQIIRLLNEDFERSGVLSVVSAYSSKPMIVGAASLELSVPTSGWWENVYRLPRSPLTPSAHIDEGLDYPKSIVYLSDVNPENGPTMVYPGVLKRLGLTPLQLVVGRMVGAVGTTPESKLKPLYDRKYYQAFSSEVFRRHFMMLPSAMRYNCCFGWDVLPDSELEKSMLASEQRVLGSAGTYVVFDGPRLVHRGGMIESGERIVLQVVFSEAKSVYTLARNKILRRLRQRLGLPK